MLAALEHALGEHGGGPARVVRSYPVGGGCISPAARIELDDGTRVFLKWSVAGDASPGFESEAVSLAALHEARALRVPVVRAIDPAWLALEWLEPGAPRAGTWEALGHGLARLHTTKGDAFGWPEDNRIGSLPQRNRRHAHWADFWREERLLPQWEQAVSAGRFTRADERGFAGVCDGLADLLAAGDADGPSLLHGDLWSGNVHVMHDGEPALIDPASYHGHREVDLAMAALFGGFGEGFFDAYNETWPLQDGNEPARRSAYQLYYLLVHVNLFGPGYVAGVRSALRTVLE